MRNVNPESPSAPQPPKARAQATLALGAPASHPCATSPAALGVWGWVRGGRPLLGGGGRAPRISSWGCTERQAAEAGRRVGGSVAIPSLGSRRPPSCQDQDQPPRPPGAAHSSHLLVTRDVNGGCAHPRAPTLVSVPPFPGGVGHVLARRGTRWGSAWDTVVGMGLWSGPEPGTCVLTGGCRPESGRKTWSSHHGSGCP